MADAVGLELLREGSLLLDILSLAGAESAVDLCGAAGGNRPDPVEVDAGLVAGIAEHGARLAALEQHDLGALQLLPGEVGVGRAPGQEEAVHLVDLGEVDDRRRPALVERREGRRSEEHTSERQSLMPISSAVSGLKNTNIKKKK